MLIWTSGPDAISQSFLFLDRDGVINEDSPAYIKNVHEFKFYPDVLEALKLLRERRFNVIVISNQSGLNRGVITAEDFWEIHGKMVQGIREAGGDLLATVYCPHRPDEQCRCRKPAPGMILAASRLFGIPLSGATCMIGDRMKDIQTGAAAGCRGILLERSDSCEAPGSGTGAETVEWSRCASLLEAVRSLL